MNALFQKKKYKKYNEVKQIKLEGESDHGLFDITMLNSIEKLS